jgi:hypothetical protein
MVKRYGFGLVAVAICLAFFVSLSGIIYSEENGITARQLIERHLKALGGVEKLATVKSMGISGRAGVQFFQGATGNLVGGQFLCVSDGPKMGLQVKFDDINYPGEYFAYDGKEVTVGYISPGQRSPVADFIFLNYPVMSEGFLGGVWSTAWPLKDVDAIQSKMKLGEKEIDGKKLYELEYGGAGKRPGNMRIKLYFDPETYHHVRTEYNVRVAGDLTSTRDIVPGQLSAAPPEPVGRPNDRQPGATVMQSLPDSIYLMVEKFGDFADVGGLVLPRSYSIDYSVEGQGASFVAKWSFAAQYFKRNGNIDQSFFVAQK